MRKHLDEQIVNYGQQVVINLVSSTVQYWGFVLALFPGPSQLFSLVLKSLGRLGTRPVLHTIACQYVLYIIVCTLSGRPKGFWEKTRRSVSVYHYFSWELSSEVCGDMNPNALNNYLSCFFSSSCGFDFHKECSKLRWHRLSILLNQLTAKQEEFG